MYATRQAGLAARTLEPDYFNATPSAYDFRLGFFAYREDIYFGTGALRAFPSELTAAPGRDAVAWLLNERGARNVWYAAAPDFKGVRLTNWTPGSSISLPTANPWSSCAAATWSFRDGPIPIPRLTPRASSRKSGLFRQARARAGSPRDIRPCAGASGLRVVADCLAKIWRSPVLLIHGDDDRNVSFSETVTLVGALRAQGVYFEQLIIPDEIHGFLRHASWLRAYPFFSPHSPMNLSICRQASPAIWH